MRLCMIFCFTCLCIFNSLTDNLSAVQQSSSNSRTFYIDSRLGNDNNSGTSPEQPWQTLDKVNSVIYKPGEKILFKAGTHYNGQLKPQGSGAMSNGKARPVIIDMYGDGDKPLIEAGGIHRAALYLYNVEYWEINNLEITNTGKHPKARRTGVFVHINNFGTAHHIHLKNLHIHDVNGSLVKKQGAGYAIYYRNEGSNLKSRFDGLLIEGCHMVRCQRNAICGSGYRKRNQWYPNLNVHIRKNLIEQVPGDGIVPNCCDGAIVEHNIMRDCPRLLPKGEAAAGIWPWSCDNTIIQFNEVSDHKAPWDAQGFDSDWNCQNTIIQYNYSHDNEGGFLLICNNSAVKMPDNVGNIGTIVRYNISVNDGFRRQPTHQGIFSPTFHISGLCKDTQIYNNTIYIDKKPTDQIDQTLLKMDNWGNQWPLETVFANNIFYVEDQIKYDYGKARKTVFENNLYYGKHINAPDDSKALLKDPLFVNPDKMNVGVDAFLGYRLNRNSPCFAAGKIIDDNGGSDFSGTRLPVGNKPAIGAFQYNAPSQTSQPLR